MKKVLMTMVALMMSVATFAQFEQGKLYANANMSGMNFSYTGAEKWKFDIGAKAGYMIEDCFMVTGQADFSCRNNDTNSFTLGAGVRYYVVQNGLYIGAGANYKHMSVAGASIDDFMPTVQIGYAFFLSKTVTIEPEFYYNQSFKDHSNFSEAGIRVGIGIYLDEL